LAGYLSATATAALAYLSQSERIGGGIERAWRVTGRATAGIFHTNDRSCHEPERLV